MMGQIILFCFLVRGLKLVSCEVKFSQEIIYKTFSKSKLLSL